jgi:hypothetical protein
MSMVCEYNVSFLSLFYWRTGQPICAIDVLFNKPEGQSSTGFAHE